MSIELFEPWSPIENLPFVAYLEALRDDYEGFRILLRGKEAHAPVFRIAFESVVAYRNVNESFRLATWAAIGNMGKLPTFLTVENSRWIEWLVAEAGGVLRADALTHYAIYSPEDCIDIVSEFPPEVEWLNP